MRLTGVGRETVAMTFEEWFGAQLPRLLRFTTVLCGSPDPAEEVLQEVALKAHRRWDTLQHLDHPESYLRRMIVNEHLSWRRKWARLIPQAELREPESTTVHFADQYADRAELMIELNKLPKRQKAVVVLRYYEGMTDTDIAELPGCSMSTVRSHMSRALATLRIEMVDRGSHTTTEEGTRAH
jgi:RNA polymerase sigma-70 factor (sigma-E family)